MKFLLEVCDFSTGKKNMFFKDNHFSHVLIWKFVSSMQIKQNLLLEYNFSSDKLDSWSVTIL